MAKISVITGATQGIGKAISLGFAKAGYSVALIARTASALEKSVAEIQSAGGHALGVPCDVANEQSVANALRAIESKLGTPSVLVNNAGIGGPFHRADEVSTAEWKSIFATNVDGMHYFCRGLLPQMKAKGFGRIINISSIFGISGGPQSSTYSSTKHAVIGYTKSVAAEWGRYGVTCNAICPGYINTEMLRNYPDEQVKKDLRQRIPVDRFGEPEEIAELALYLAGPSAGYINGSAITIDGGLASHLALRLPEF